MTGWRERWNEKGLDPVKSVAYEYHDEKGRLCFVKQRWDLMANGGKLFGKTFTVEHRPDPVKRPFMWAGGIGPWSWLMYNLPEFLHKSQHGKDIWWTEGEKDAEALRRSGCVGAITTHHQGIALASSSQARWVAVNWQGQKINLVIDRDRAGAYIGWYHRELLINMAVDPEAIRLLTPCIKKNKADLTDHLEAGWELFMLDEVDPEVARKIAIEVLKERKSGRKVNGYGG